MGFLRGCVLGLDLDLDLELEPEFTTVTFRVAVVIGIIAQCSSFEEKSDLRSGKNASLNESKDLIDASVSIELEVAATLPLEVCLRFVIVGCVYRSRGRSVTLQGSVNACWARRSL